MSNECRCGRPTRDTLTTCETCSDELARSLAEIPWMADELATTITKQRAIPTEGGPRGGETALLWHEKASDARRHLHSLLVSWVRFCDEEGVAHQSPKDGLPDDTLPALSRWMLWRVDGLARHEIGPDATEEILSAMAECRRVIDRSPDRWYAGPCVQEVDNVACGTDLYARRTKGDVTCRECAAVYDVAERRAWLLAEAEDRLANASDVARAVSWLGARPLTPARVWQWAKRGRIVAKGHDGKAPLYRVGDAIDLLAADTVKAG